MGGGIMNQVGGYQHQLNDYTTNNQNPHMMGNDGLPH